MMIADFFQRLERFNEPSLRHQRNKPTAKKSLERSFIVHLEPKSYLISR
jgi:hypothetical protein